MKTLDLKKSLSSFFPESSIPRPQQAEALEKIQTHFNSDKKYVIACLPTGSGKSHIGLTVGNSTRQIDHRLKNLINDYSVYKKNKNGEYIHENDFLNADPFGAYILTITKSLQDQYQNLYDYVPTIKGKNNYQCDVDSAYSAENAPCLFSKKIKESNWSYDNQNKKDIFEQPISVETTILKIDIKTTGDLITKQYDLIPFHPNMSDLKDLSNNNFIFFGRIIIRQ